MEWWTGFGLNLAILGGVLGGLWLVFGVWLSPKPRSRLFEIGHETDIKRKPPRPGDKTVS